MSLHEIFQKVQSWLTELWSYLIPRTTLFVWVIIIGALVAIFAFTVLAIVNPSKRVRSKD